MRTRLASLVLVSLAAASCGGPRENPLPLSSPTFDKALAILQTQAHSGDPTVRANCIEALQVSRDPRAAEIIEQGLHDGEWVVRFAAAMAAGERKLAEVRPVLNTLVEHDPNGSVRAGCIFALRRLGDTSHMNGLRDTFTSSDPQVRANTAFVLGKLGEDSAIPLLQLRRDDSDLRVRFEIAAALARLGDELAQQVIVADAVSKYAEDQWNAMVVCADLPASVGSSPLLLGLTDVPPKLPQGANPATVRDLTTVRQLLAARGLAKMRYGSREAGVTAAKIAIDNLRNSTPQIRALALMALGEMLSSREAYKLDAMLSDPDEPVRRAAAAAVVNIFARAAKGQ